MKLRVQFILPVLFLTLFFSYMGHSQVFEEFDVDKEGQEPKDEKKEVVKIDPSIASWIIADFGAFQDSTKLDTLLDNYQIYLPALENAITSSYVGNYGTPAINNDFFNRSSNVDFLFLKSREAYLLTPATVQYYNTKTPFSRLDFGQSGNKSVKNETRFKFFHSQNVNPYLNFTLQISMNKSAGQYNAQESKNNFITLYSSYNKENLNIYSGVITNNVKNEENGGLTNDSLLFNGQETEFLNTNLNSSKSNFKNTYYLPGMRCRPSVLISRD